VSPFDLGLRDGRTVHVRAVTPADQAELLQTFERMNDHARYMRFMRVVREPDVAKLREVLESFPAAGTGIVATVPAADGIDIVGSAVAVIEPGAAGRCEFAISVDAAYGGTGLGTALMRALIDAATRRGLTEMVGFVLGTNKPMLALARRLGFAIAYDPDDPGVRICRLALGAA